MPVEEMTQYLKETAKILGFSYVGVSKAQRLDNEARKLETWLNKGMHGTMGYMENYFEMRTDPRVLVPGAKSVVSLLYNYYPAKRQEEGMPQVSVYAYGDDYHKVIRRKLKELLSRLREKWGDVHGRVFVDSAPVLERAWAARSGVGWIGKNAHLITKEQGSFFFLAELIIDIELVADLPIKDYCGTCTRCIDACPTEAISPDGIVNGSKCISYFTIELSENIPSGMDEKFGNWIFGCDVCQDVCPWNRFSKSSTEKAFTINEKINQSKEQWLEMTEDVFESAYKTSPFMRVGLENMKRNVRRIISSPNVLRPENKTKFTKE